MTDSMRRMPAGARRAALVGHAIRSYTELGLGRAGHGDVAKRAGVSTGTVFNYFPTREALTKAVLDHVRERCNATFLSMLPATGALRGNLETIRQALSAACDEAPDEHRLFLSWAHSFNPDVRPQFLAFREGLLKTFVPIIGSGEHAPDDAHILFGTALMYMQMHFDHEEEDVLRRFADRLETLIRVLDNAPPDIR